MSKQSQKRIEVEIPEMNSLISEGAEIKVEALGEENLYFTVGETKCFIKADLRELPEALIRRAFYALQTEK